MYRYAAFMVTPIFASRYFFPFTLANPSCYLLGEPASLARGVNTHPLLFLVSYQLFSPCCITHPKAPHRSSYIFTKTTSISAVSSDTISNKCGL